MIQQKEIILTFFPNSKVRKEYEDMFPYDKLKKDFQFLILVRNLTKTAKKNEIQIIINPLTKAVHALMHKCEMLRKRHATSAYLSRARGYYPNRLEVQHIEFGPYPKAKFRKRMIVTLFSNQFGVLLLRKLVTILFQCENRRWKNVPDNLHCILLPYTGGISAEWDFLVWFGRRSGIPTIAIQENWDNLSSKQFLFEKPTVFTTWGKQSSSHLRTIQSFRGVIKEVGCIRVQGFYDSRATLEIKSGVTLAQDNLTPKPILIVGVGDDLTDLKLLRDLSKYVEKSQNHLAKKLRFIYRPHPNPQIPWRSEKILDDITKLPHVVIDNPLPSESNSQRIRKIKDFNVIASLFSTMVLESAILNKTCILPTFVFEIADYDSRNLIDDYYHFSGMALLSNVKVADSLDSFVEIALENNTEFELNKQDDKLLNWFCRNANTQDELIGIIHSLKL